MNKNPVDLTALKEFFLRYFFKYLMEGLTQNIRASGMKKLPLIQTDILFLSKENFDGFLPRDRDTPSSSLPLIPTNFL